jgi:hypothetical protein
MNCEWRMLITVVFFNLVTQARLASNTENEQRDDMAWKINNTSKIKMTLRQKNTRDLR